MLLKLDNRKSHCLFFSRIFAAHFYIYINIHFCFTGIIVQIVIQTILYLVFGHAVRNFFVVDLKYEVMDYVHENLGDEK